MSKPFIIGATIAIIIVVVGLLLKEDPVVMPDTDKYEMTIDSLNKEIRDLANTNDSILSVIVTSNGKIDTIKYTYEKEFINITNQPIANDVVFFTEYLSEVGK